MENSHPLPDFGNVRLATPADLTRISVVSTASAFDTPNFRYKRTYHIDFPFDTHLAQMKNFLEAMQDPACVVLVAEDAYEPDETTKTGAVFVNNGSPCSWAPVSKGEKVVVGTLLLRLEPGTERVGQFNQYEQDAFPELPHNPGRDLNKNNSTAMGEIDAKLWSENCAGFSYVRKLGVHPAYANRGHGTALMKWARELSNQDGVSQGLKAVNKAVPFYRRLGYESICEVINDNGDEKLYSTLMKYVPSSPREVQPFQKVNAN